MRQGEVVRRNVKTVSGMGVLNAHPQEGRAHIDAAAFEPRPNAAHRCPTICERALAVRDVAARRHPGDSPVSEGARHT